MKDDLLSGDDISIIMEVAKGSLQFACKRHGVNVSENMPQSEVAHVNAISTTMAVFHLLPMVASLKPDKADVFWRELRDHCEKFVAELKEKVNP